MKAQIEALYRLQAQDHQTVALDRRLAAIPARLAEMDDDLAQLQQMIDSERARLDESRKFRARQEQLLADEEEQIKATKTRLGGIKNTRELNAAQRELESVRRMAQARSQELETLESAVSTTEERIATMEKSIAELAEQFTGERAKLEADKAEVLAQYEARKGKRDELAADVDRPLLAQYERIRRKVGGIVFVGVRERQCLACKIQVAHSIYVAMRKAEILPSCDNCGRMQYWTGLFNKEESAPAQPAPAPAKRAKAKPKAAPKSAGSKSTAKKPAEGDSDAATGSEAALTREPAPKKKKVTRTSKKLVEGFDADAKDLAPKLAHNKVLHDQAALDGAPTELPSEKSPKAAPAPKQRPADVEPEEELSEN